MAQVCMAMMVTSPEKMSVRRFQKSMIQEPTSVKTVYVITRPRLMPSWGISSWMPMVSRAGVRSRGVNCVTSGVGWDGH